MRFNVNKPPKHIKRERDRLARQEWHKKFAWKATKVDRTDIGHRVVWFENYWRKEKIGATNSEKDDGRYFEQYSEKEYFKKKLNGDFDNYGIEDERQSNSVQGQIINAGASSSVARYQIDRGTDGQAKNIKIGSLAQQVLTELEREYKK